LQNAPFKEQTLCYMIPSGVSFGGPVHTE
jgi:hypothetical protein